MGKEKTKDTSEHITSMTGYGSASVRSESVALEIEARSVNSRFLDTVIRMPKIYSKFEIALRELVSTLVHRGRVEVYVNRVPVAADACGVSVNLPLLAAYREAYEGVFLEEKLLDEDTKRGCLRDILGRGDVLVLEQGSGIAEKEEALLCQGVEEAIKKLVRSRQTEGKKIALDLVSRLDKLRTLRESISQSSEKVPVSIRERLEERLQKLSSEMALDPDRITMEAAIVADRADVTEELVRLSSHLEEFQVIMQQPPNGRKLEFMLQEIGREFNTIGSKSVSAEVPQMVVEAKSEIEKLKEQIQNVE